MYVHMVVLWSGVCMCFGKYIQFCMCGHMYSMCSAVIPINVGLSGPAYVNTILNR